MNNQISNEEKINKLWKSSRNNVIIIFILQLILTFLLNGGYLLLSILLHNITYIIAIILTIALHVFTIIGCQKHEKWGAVLGIVLALIYLFGNIYSRNWIGILLGTLLLIDFIRLNIQIRKK